MTKTSNHFIILLLVIVVGKLTGFLKDIVFTFFFGVSSVSDAYFLSMSISSLLHAAIYSVIPIVVVPIYSKLLASSRSGELNRGLTSTAGFFLLLSLSLSVFVFFFSDTIVRIFSGNVSSDVSELSSRYLAIMAITFSLSSIVSFLNSIQTVNKVVMPSYSVPVVNNLVFCLGLFLFSSPDNFVYVLVLGVVAWAILLFFNYLIVRGWFVIRLSSIFEKIKDRDFLLLFLPALLSFYIEQINNYIAIYFASDLGKGAISVFSYSHKLNMILLSVFLVVLTTSIFPRIAKMVAVGASDDLRGYLKNSIRLILIILIPFSVFVSFNAVNIVSLLFERGSFTADNAANVGAIFSVIVVAVPLCLIRDVMNRVFFSYGNTTTPVLVSVVALSINFVLCYLLQRQFGITGLALAVLISTAFQSMVIMFLVQKKTRFGLFNTAFRVLCPCVVAVGASAALLIWLNEMFPSLWALWGAPFLIVYFAIFYLLGAKEFCAAKDFLTKGGAK